MQTRINEDVIREPLSAIEDRDAERILAINHPDADFRWLPSACRAAVPVRRSWSWRS
jgi:hypothetical protein